MMTQCEKENFFLQAKQIIKEAHRPGTIESIETQEYGKDFLQKYIDDLFRIPDIAKRHRTIESGLFTGLFLGSWSGYVSQRSIDAKLAKRSEETFYASVTPPNGWLPKGYDPERHGNLSEIDLQSFWDSEREYLKSPFGNVAFSNGNRF